MYFHQPIAPLSPNNYSDQRINPQNFILIGLLLVVFCCATVPNVADAARFTTYFPLPIDHPVASDVDESPLPPQAANLAPESSAPWQAYCDAWRKHHANPSDNVVRQQLGISAETTAVAVTNGRSTAVAMRLPITEMQRFETEHFVLLSDGKADRAVEVVRDFERFYLVWTQIFFPLWKDREYWDQTVKPRSSRTPIKHRVVLFATSTRYAELLRGEGPGVGQSTGFYSDVKRVTFLHDGEVDDSASRYHELTHQLMAEATTAKSRLRPGERNGFWIVEGIACYMESTVIHADRATVGGWQASRLQHARHRVLGLGDDLPLQSLENEGRLAVQHRSDLSRWYAFVAAYTHQWIDQDDGAGLVDVMERLAQVYQMRSPILLSRDKPATPQKSLVDSLQIGDDELLPVIVDDWKELCLTHTSVTAAGLATIPPTTMLKWLDLSFLKINTADVTRLCPQSSSLEQLSLEATAVDDSIADWLTSANKLRELDLSSTRIGDDVIAKLPMLAPIETLWLTGSQISDASIDRIIAMRSLKQVDMQLTRVTEPGTARLRAARTDLQVNPLKVAAP